MIDNTSAQAADKTLPTVGESFKAAPRWQQVTLSVIFVLGALGLSLMALDTYQERAQRPYVAEITQVATALKQASDIGDRAGAVTLYDPVSALLMRMTDDPATQQAPLRFCRIALIGLARDMDQVAEGRKWDSGTFDRAMRECKK